MRLQGCWAKVAKVPGRGVKVALGGSGDLVSR